jgi:hypothetical protein
MRLDAVTAYRRGVSQADGCQYRAQSYRFNVSAQVRCNLFFSRPSISFHAFSRFVLRWFMSMGVAMALLVQWCTMPGMVHIQQRHGTCHTIATPMNDGPNDGL